MWQDAKVDEKQNDMMQIFDKMREEMKRCKVTRWKKGTKLTRRDKMQNRDKMWQKDMSHDAKLSLDAKRCRDTKSIWWDANLWQDVIKLETDQKQDVTRCLKMQNTYKMSIMQGI